MPTLSIDPSLSQHGPYGVVSQCNVDVPFRDGTISKADLFYPDTIDVRAWPTVLVRTAYNRSWFRGDAEFFASHGFLAVTQDVRGTFGSSGSFFAFRHEAEDGVDTLRWIAAHGRSNGEVGMYGCSYMSWVQLAVATQNPPTLKCLIPFGVAIDTFHHYAYPNGGLQLGLISWIIYDVWRQAAALHDDHDALAAINDLNFVELAAQMPWRRGETLLARSPQFEELVFAYLENRNYTSFWHGPGEGFQRYFADFPDIPMLWVSGWYDGYPRSVCQGYTRLREQGFTHQYLLNGPWIHNQMSGNVCGEVDFGPDADTSQRCIQLAFFKRFLQHDNTVSPGAPVRAFIMGGGSGRKTADNLLHHGGTWWNGSEWPPSATTASRWYLHDDGGLAEEPPLTQDSETSYVHDPAQPVPSIAPPWVFHGYHPRGPHDVREPNGLIGNCIPGRPLADRPDVCVFQTPPLEHAVCVLGPMHVVLYVSSDCVDTDFVVRLVDVYPRSRDYPDGYAFPVCEGMQRMSYRRGDDMPSPMVPHKRYKVTFECFPAANLFAIGHRIRVDVASSNFPRFDINRNTGDPKSAVTIRATNTVYHCASQPSHIVLQLFADEGACA